MRAKLIKGKKADIFSSIRWVSLLHAIVHSAGIQDRDGGIALAGDAVRSVSHSLQKLLRRQCLIKGRFWQRARQNPSPVSKTKLSDDPIKRKGSCSYPSVGLSNAPLPGSTVATASPRTGKSQPKRPRILETRVHSSHVAKTL